MAKSDQQFHDIFPRLLFQLKLTIVLYALYMNQIGKEEQVVHEINYFQLIKKLVNQTKKRK